MYKRQESSTSQRYAQKQQRNLDEFENILSLMDDASDLVEPFSKTTSEELSSLLESDLSQETESSLEQTANSLKNQGFQSAQNSSSNSNNLDIKRRRRQ